MKPCYPIFGSFLAVSEVFRRKPALDYVPFDPLIHKQFGGKKPPSILGVLL
jgi:cytochrome P450